MGGEATEISGPPPGCSSRRPTGTPLDVPHRTPPQDHLRGRQAQRARRRPDGHRGRRRPRRRAARRPRRRHRRARRHRGRRGPAAAPHRDGRRPARPHHRPPSTPPPRSRTCAAVGCAVEERGDVLVAVPPPWRPDLTDPHDLVEEVARVVGYDQVPSVLPTPPAGRGLTRAQRLRRRVGRTLAGAGCVEVVSFPFLGDADLDKLGLPADDAAPHHGAARQPAVGREAVLHHHAAAGPAHRPRPATSAAAPTGVALFETGPSPSRVDGGPAPIYGVDRRPDRRRARHAARRRAAPAAAPRRRAGRASASARAGGVPGASVLVRRGRRSSPPWPTSSASPPRCVPATGRRGTPAAAPRCVVAATALGHAGELHPPVCQAFGPPAAQRGRRGRPRRADRAAPATSSRPGVLVVPGGQGGRRAARRRRRARRRGRGGAARGRRRPAGVGAALRRLHRRRRSARAASPWPSRCASARPTAP